MPARVQLAARRKVFGFSQEALAQELQVTTSAVSRWEQGTSTPKAIYRQPLARALQLSPVELERLLDVDGHTIPGVNGQHLPGWLGHYASLEQSASELRTFEPLVIPALLQTADYATAVERHHHQPVTAETISSRVEARLARQAVLDRDPAPLALITVIDEAVLHRNYGSARMMASQLEQLLLLADRPTIDIQIMPLATGGYGAAFGAFQLLTSNGSAGPFLACSEDLTGKHYLDGVDAIAAHHQLFEYLLTRSLDAEASMKIIHQRKEISLR